MSPTSANLPALGETIQLTVTVNDRDGKAMPGATVTWSSGAPAVASVGGTGLVTAVGNGSATITAAAGGVSATAAVKVDQVPTAVELSRDSLVFEAFGEEATAAATVSDRNGHEIEGAGVEWSSDNTGVAVVDADGRIESVGNGRATITAAAGGVSATAAVKVDQVPAMVALSPDSLAFEAFGEEATVAATVSDRNGHEIEGAGVEWSSDNTAVALVDAAGRVASVGNGRATIAAAAGGVSATAAVKVDQVPAMVELSPDSLAFEAFGEEATVAATVSDRNAHEIEGAVVEWSSADTTVVVVNAAGLVTAVSKGNTRVTATSAGVVGAIEVAVSQVPAAVKLSPDSLAFGNFGDTATLTATVSDRNGHEIEGAGVEWSSDNTAVAVVDADGRIESVGNGRATITAAAGGVSATAAVKVDQVPAMVELSPDSLAFEAFGEEATVAATVSDGNGHEIDGAVVEWSSADTTVVVVNAAGLVTAVSKGNTRVTATSAGVVGAIEVAVSQVPAAVKLSPDSLVFGNFGDTATLTATVSDRNGHEIEGAGVEWSSDNTAVALVGNNGVVRATGEGTTYVRARSDAVEDSARVSVASVDRQVLIRFYEATSGPGWINNTNWLTEEPMRAWHGVAVDLVGRVSRLILNQNNLTGSVPPALGNLDRLKWLFLHRNSLTGPVPPELGNLHRLASLGLDRNNLTGPVPPELGQLDSLKSLFLSGNSLTGPVPPELGNLDRLKWLFLSWNNLTGPIPPELGQLDSLKSLYLSWNNLTGPIPPELGQLDSLESLDLSGNNLTGSVPPELGNLDRLEQLYLSRNDGLCVPGTQAFAWVDSIRASAFWCNEADKGALEALYEQAGGNGWHHDDGWLGNAILDDWYGVDTEAQLGRVTRLDLGSNKLDGTLSAGVGNLAELRTLKLNTNPNLGGRLPLSLVRLSKLDTLRYDGTGLCTPTDSAFREWLRALSSHVGSGTDCGALTDRDVLVALYHATGGPSWHGSTNWLTARPLKDWYGVADSQGRVTELDLRSNNLTGPIPPELGQLDSLESLGLSENNLTGPVPPELGNLDRLERLELTNNNLTGPVPPELGNLDRLERLELTNNNLTGPVPPELGNLDRLEKLHLPGNNLTGPVPPELGNLDRLWGLSLSENNLTGPVPPELGNLDRLGWLFLSENNLTGPVPPELGNLDRLWGLFLSGNNLTGPVPPELGNLGRLKRLELTNNNLTGPIPPELGRLSRLAHLGLSRNADLSGVLPDSLTTLDSLRTFIAGNTRLCAPSDSTFLAWLKGVRTQRVSLCAPAAAYLTQAVQSREYPVPLVAREESLLRAFVTATNPGNHTMPRVVARFYRNNTEVYKAEIPASSNPIPKKIDESSLKASANAVIPGTVVRPGLELVVEVDPDGTLDDSVGVARRIPAKGRLAIEVLEAPRFSLTVIPFLYKPDPDSSIIETVKDMAVDEESHDLLQQTAYLLAVEDMDVTAHSPVETSSRSGHHVLRETGAIRVLESGTGHWMGTLPGFSDVGGVAHRPGWNSASIPRSDVIVHELGHNFSLLHAPCGRPAGVDPDFPDRYGRIGAWGYALRTVARSPSGKAFRKGELVSPEVPDLMSYCGDPEWISDYFFAKAHRFRVDTEGGGLPDEAPAPARSLLLWGGVDSTGSLHLEPAFVVDAPPALPVAGGDHVLEGRSVDGAILFSLGFEMPRIADAGEGTGGFVYALPIRPEWEGLASLTLTGPEGPDEAVTLDGDTDTPMAIYRDRRTGEIRAFLRGAWAGGDPPPGMNVLRSRGIPGPEAWRR